ncbi:MAG: energy transducer TonB [Candidatus Eisenbacteria bacterium]
MRTPWLVVLTLAVAAIAAGDVVPGAPPKPVPTSRATSDPEVDSIAGVYAPDTDPGERIDRGGVGGDRVSIRSRAGWDALGWYAHDDFIGAWRRLGPAGDGPSAYGWLWFHAQPGRVVTARFTDEAGGAARTEKWKFLYRFGEGPGPAPDSTNGDRSHALEEYVYVKQLPEAITKVPPVYPDDARRRRLHGTVMTQALVGMDGNVREVRIVRSVSGLDSAAVAAVRQWRFKPARASDGRSVTVWVAIPVKFPPP